MMWGYHGDGGWLMWFGGVMMVLFWIGLFFAIYWIARVSGADRERVTAPAMPPESAEEIARRRLAAGEIDEMQYERIAAHLSGPGETAR